MTDPGATPDPYGPPPAIGTEVVTTEVLVSNPSPRRVRIPTFVVGLVAVALVGGLVGRGLLFGSGGASSPTAAVEQLAEALSAEDLPAVLSILAPDEVRDAADVYASTTTKLQRLGVTPEDKTLGGVDLGIADLRLEAHELGPDVAKVEIVGGKATWAVHPEDLGSKVQGVAKGADRDELSGSHDLADLEYEDESGDEHEAFLMVVRRDGGWYVSPFYSIAEMVVSYSDARPGDFGPLGTGPAAPSPDQAVARLIDAVNGRDVDAGIDALASREWAVLRTYRAAIVEAVGDAGIDADEELIIDEWETTTEDRGDVAEVRFTKLAGHYVTSEASAAEWDAYYEEMDATDWETELPEPVGEPRRVDWSFRDGCLRVDDPDEPFDSCDLAADEGFGVVTGLDQTMSDAMREMGQAPIMVVRDGDGWSVSPVATLLDAARRFVGNLDSDTVARFVGSELDAEPSATARLGKETKVQLNSAGFAVVGFDASEGTPFAVTTDSAGAYGFGELRYRDPAGEDGESYDHLFLDPDGGTYRFLVEGKANGTVAFTARSLPAAVVLDPAVPTPVHLDEGAPFALLSLTVPDGAELRPELDDVSYATLSIFDEDGQDVELGDDEDWDGDWSDPTLLDAGRYTLVVSLDSGTYMSGGGWFNAGLDDEDEVELPTEVDVVVTATDPTTVPHFGDGSSTMYDYTVELVGGVPDPDEERTELTIPAGMGAVLRIDVYDDTTLQVLRSCDGGPWIDSGPLPVVDGTATLPLPGAAAEQRCQLASIGSETYVDLDYTLSPG